MNTKVAAGEMWQALLVSVVVVAVFTVAASVFEQFHQVAAEDLNTRELSAVSAGNNLQKIVIPGWGVQLTAPLGQTMPLMKYTVQGPDSVGLSSAAVEAYGSKCSAAHNGVGALVRMPQGDWAKTRVGYMMGTVGGYDYAYETPQTDCAEVGNARDAESFEGIEIEGVGVLSASE